MATDTPTNQHPLDYGDTVRVKDSAPDRFCPGQKACVVGFNEIMRERLNLPTGTKTCVIEFRNGESIEVPEQYLELLEKYEQGGN